MKPQEISRMAADILGDDSRPRQASNHGSGTKVSGYLESPVEKRCGTCAYLQNQKLCSQETVLKDPELEDDQGSGMKVVDPKTGCCDYWEAPHGAPESTQPREEGGTGGLAGR